VFKAHAEASVEQSIATQVESAPVVEQFSAIEQVAATGSPSAQSVAAAVHYPSAGSPVLLHVYPAAHTSCPTVQ